MKQIENERPLIPQQYQHAAALAVILLSLMIFFREVVFEGKIILSPDDIGPQSFSTFVEDARQQGVFPLWNPYIFCGMPAYGSLMVSGERSFDLFAFIWSGISRVGSTIFLNPQNGWPFFYYFVMAAGIYLLTYRKLGQKLPALIAALATIFSMYIIIWAMTGHGTKILVMTFFPWILFFVDRLLERFSLLDALLLILALHFALDGAHIQMLYYVFLAVGIYFFFHLIRDFVKKTDWKSTLLAGLVFTAATLIAFTMAADRYLSLLEYTSYSIRGAAPAVPSMSDQSAPADKGGLDYDYASKWSLGVGETFTMVVPSLYGFGTHEYEGPLTNQQPYRINTYFGPQPFTQAPQYMGVVVLVFAIVGFWRNRKVQFVQYLAVTIVFSMLVAFGSEFPLVYNLLFSYLPGFNRFRIPSMILVLVQMLTPILAAYGIATFLTDRNQIAAPRQQKRWRYALVLLSALFVTSLVARSVPVSIYGIFFSAQEVIRVFTQKGYDPRIAREFYNIITNLVATDVIAASGLLLAAFGAVYFYQRRMFKLTTLAVVLAVAVLIDLWRVASTQMDVQNRQFRQQVFAEPDYVSTLHQDSSLYRVLEFENGVPPFDNKYAYWRIESAFGYQGAKMRRYQDLVDVVGIRNPVLWQIMNVKYIITNQPDSSRWLGLIYDTPEKKVYVNRTVLPRAFFVNRYEVADGQDVLTKMAAGFDARDVAYLAEDPNVKIDPPLPGAGASFAVHDIQHIVINLRTLGNNLLFLSEVYYPEGWKAFLDGAEIPIHRANYHFRAVVVPPGSHTLEMKFEPRGFYLGKNLSLAANIVVLGGLAVVGGNYWRKRKTKAAE